MSKRYPLTIASVKNLACGFAIPSQDGNDLIGKENGVKFVAGKRWNYAMHSPLAREIAVDLFVWHDDIAQIVWQYEGSKAGIAKTTYRDNNLYRASSYLFYLLIRNFGIDIERSLHSIDKILEE